MDALGREAGDGVPQAGERPNAWGAVLIALLLFGGLVVLVALNMN